MEKTIKLNIIAPGRQTITENIISLTTTEADGKVEFQANYVQSIIATIPTVSIIKMANGEKKRIFTSSGIIYIEDSVINFCCDSVNWSEEIDKKRAELSRDRAIKRLESKEDINVERAKKSLERANSRLELIQ